MANRIGRAVFWRQNTANLFSSRVVFTTISNGLAIRGFSKNTDKGFWDSIIGGGGDSRSGAHSKILSEKETLYEFQFHHLKPDRMKDYTELISSELPRISDDPEFPAKLLGSWTTIYGPLDSAVHLWVYKAGYRDVTTSKQYLQSNKKFLEFANERSPMLYKRHNQLLHGFSFWGEPELRDSKNLYELRTYYLKPGTLIEWGNNWINAIKYRRTKNEDVGGFFTQMGELYVVHHLWAYSNFAVRKETREAAWDSPNWADCVANTVPLIRKMESRIMLPFSFSPLT